MRNQSHARRQKFGAGSFDIKRFSVFRAESNAMIETGILAAFQFSLSNRSLECNIPQSGSILLIRLSPFKIAQKCFLRNTAGVVSDCVISLSPIDRQSQRTPQSLKKLLVGFGQFFAKFDEIPARTRNLVFSLNLLSVCPFKRRLEIRIILKRRIDAHAVIILNASLRGQTVVVPPHRIENVKPAHSLVTGDNVRVRIRKNMPHVKVSGHSRRRRINRIHVFALDTVPETVGFVFVPPLGPLVFQALHADFVRQGSKVRTYISVIFSHRASLWIAEDIFAKSAYSAV